MLHYRIYQYLKWHIFFTRGNIRRLDLYTVVNFVGKSLYIQNQPKPIDGVDQTGGGG